MKHLLKIKDVVRQIMSARVRDNDPLHGHRSTVTLVVDLTYREVVDLFSDPGAWSVTRQYEPKTDTDGKAVYQEPDIVTDCTDYDILCSIKDNRTGVLEVVMGKITDTEALAELREVLNG